MSNIQAVLGFVDYAAVFVFAATGALAAARQQHDIITFAFYAAVTGVGGGTLRDLLSGVPVFWVRHAEPLEETLQRQKLAVEPIETVSSSVEINYNSDDLEIPAVLRKRGEG